MATNPIATYITLIVDAQAALEEGKPVDPKKVSNALSKIQAAHASAKDAAYKLGRVVQQARAIDHLCIAAHAERAEAAAVGAADEG